MGAGARITKSSFAALAEATKQRCDDVTETYAGLIEASAAVAAPYEFGVLQASVAVEGARGGAALARRRIVVGAFYGIYQHEGTSKGIDPNPFLADATEYWRDDYLQSIRLVVPGAR